ncbi:hypothetical protein NQ317_006912 [Molorchus minor]|uniref:Uncharacterized protein n=1 Tax=Molorchus minor TaxID=1323400 RepID=A0ABQ9J6I9_9CUCU|nr:hypothetical protein NQ317_006912 [Molorchus minor]
MFSSILEYQKELCTHTHTYSTRQRENFIPPLMNKTIVMYCESHNLAVSVLRIILNAFCMIGLFYVYCVLDFNVHKINGQDLIFSETEQMVHFHIKKQISSSTSEDEDLMTVRRKKEQERDMYRISKLSLIKFIFLTKIFNFKIRSLDDVSNPTHSESYTQ